MSQSVQKHYKCFVNERWSKEQKFVLFQNTTKNLLRFGTTCADINIMLLKIELLSFVREFYDESFKQRSLVTYRLLVSIKSK